MHGQAKNVPHLLPSEAHSAPGDTARVLWRSMLVVNCMRLGASTGSHWGGELESAVLTASSQQLLLDMEIVLSQEPALTIMVWRSCSLGRARLWCALHQILPKDDHKHAQVLPPGWRPGKSSQTHHFICAQPGRSKGCQHRSAKAYGRLANLYLVMSTKNNPRDSSIHMTFDLNQHGLVICQTSSGADHKLTHRQSHQLHKLGRLGLQLSPDKYAKKSAEILSHTLTAPCTLMTEG